MSVVDTGADARPNIAIANSVMTNDRPLVPVGYGHEQYEKQEGSGGLSAASTDLARLIAILISQKNNPAMKRATINTMMSNAVSAQAMFGNRAGHGWDGVRDLGGEKYYGQKGGSLDTSGNVLQFNGDWGFAMCWAGKLIAPALASHQRHGPTWWLVVVDRGNGCSAGRQRPGPAWLAYARASRRRWPVPAWSGWAQARHRQGVGQPSGQQDRDRTGAGKNVLGEQSRGERGGAEGQYHQQHGASTPVHHRPAAKPCYHAYAAARGPAQMTRPWRRSVPPSTVSHDSPPVPGCAYRRPSVPFQRAPHLIAPSSPVLVQPGQDGAWTSNS
jgi:hypothetical protein